MREIIDRLLKLEDRATKGDWYLGSTSIPSDLLRCKKGGNIIWGQYDIPNPSDAKLIIESRNNLKPLLLRMKALEDVADALKHESCYEGDDSEQRFINSCKVLEALEKLDESEK